MKFTIFFFLAVTSATASPTEENTDKLKRGLLEVPHADIYSEDSNGLSRGQHGLGPSGPRRGLSGYRDVDLLYSLATGAHLTPQRVSSYGGSGQPHYESSHLPVSAAGGLGSLSFTKYYSHGASAEAQILPASSRYSSHGADHPSLLKTTPLSTSRYAYSASSHSPPQTAGAVSPHASVGYLGLGGLSIAPQPRYSSYGSSYEAYPVAPVGSAKYSSYGSSPLVIALTAPVAERNYGSYGSSPYGSSHLASADEPLAASRYSSLSIAPVAPLAAPHAASSHNIYAPAHASSSLALKAAQSLSQAHAAIKPAAHLALNAAIALTQAHANLKPAAALAAQAARGLNNAQASIHPAAQLAVQAAKSQVQAQAAMHAAKAQAAAKAAQAEAALRLVQLQAQSRAIQAQATLKALQAAQLQAEIKSQIVSQAALASLDLVKSQGYTRPLALSHAPASSPHSW